jgi:hypothetical protein
MVNRSSIGAMALAGALLMTWSTAQAFDESKYPDMRGQWNRVGGNPNWVPVAGPPPLTPEYRKVFQDNRTDMESGGQGANWPSAYCVPQGMPAMMNLYDPMEIVITQDVTYILISHVNDSYRRVYTDGRDWPQEGEYELTFAGYSIGKWIDEDGDGKYDVLEIETRYLKGPRGYDASGIPLHSDNQSVIRERLYLDKNDKNAITNEITVVDNALARPWTAIKKATRTATRPVWRSEVCPEENSLLKIAGEPYFMSSDGYLMPIKKGQAPPDLRYFNQSGKK